MLRRTHHRTMNWIRRVASSPRHELTRWQRAARFAYDLAVVGARRLRQDRAPQLAGALAYRTLFGLIPVLVVGTVLVQIIRGFDQLQQWLAAVFTRLGLDEIFVQAPSMGPPAPGEVPQVSKTLSEFLLEQVGYVRNYDFAALGWVGAGLLIYSAIGLMVTIENAFNVVYGAPAGRSWARRVPIYWTVLTLGPLAMAVMVYVNGVFSTLIENVHAWQWLLSAATLAWGFAVVWLVILMVYKLVPHTTVSLRSASAGALVTALLLEIGRHSLGAYFSSMLSLRMLYGSVGLIPIFMFWVYVMWLVVLFGLEVAATLQVLGGRRPDELEEKVEPGGLVDPAMVVVVMRVIAERFAAAQPTAPRQIAEATNTPEPTVRQMLDHLVRAGFLHRVAGEQGAVALARPPEQITGDRLIEIGFEIAQGGGPTPPQFLQQLRSAQKALAARVTLASLASPAPS